ncbi:MAG: hypothetical protein Q9221_000486 [Calogaya cf. arnoldii]
MTRTLQHGFYNGTWARYGDPQATITIHDRLEFHGRSHYDLRNILDAEGMEDPFVEEVEPDFPGSIIKYPDEDFTLWHAHLLTADVPLQALSWPDGCGDITETLHGYLYPYDPRDPQDEVISIGIDWTDPEDAGSTWGLADLTAISGSEVESSTDIRIRQGMLPQPPVVARLTAAAAIESGLQQSWSGQDEILPPGEVVELSAPRTGTAGLCCQQHNEGFTKKHAGVRDYADLGSRKTSPVP